jgi:DNA-binding transcriptional MerR regulator
MHNAEDLLTPAEVAKMADPPVTPALVRNWANTGRLPVLRTTSGIRLFRRSDVVHHLSDRKTLGPRAGRRRG